MYDPESLLTGAEMEVGLSYDDARDRGPGWEESNSPWNLTVQETPWVGYPVLREGDPVILRVPTPGDIELLFPRRKIVDVVN